MPFTLSRRGQCLFRHLTLRDKVPVSARLTAIPSHCRYVHQTVARRPTPAATAVILKKRVFAPLWTNYATAAGRPKGHTGRAKAKKSSNAPKKDASKPKPRKVLTEKQKEKKAAEAQRAEIRQLKEEALTTPKKLGDVGFLIAVAEHVKGSKGGTESFKEAVAHAKALTPSELEVSHLPRTDGCCISCFLPCFQLLPFSRRTNLRSQ